MSDPSWKSVIISVLEAASEPLHYSEIAQTVVDEGLRQKVGAKPANTVAAQLGYLTDQVTRVDRGTYFLTSRLHELTDIDSSSANPSSPEETAQQDFDSEVPGGIINAFGMYWRRDEVAWDTTTPVLLGTQISGGQEIDFAQQIGIYILYQGERTVYVGRAAKESLGHRLRAHTRDRLTARWDRFSWFGLRPVSDSGGLKEYTPRNVSSDLIAETMEAILIEGLEPPQNRRRGDKIEDSEFIQITDPQIEKKRYEAMLERLRKKL
ncbi:winged helix-turn-helix domain-containing protein [uncultured Corynebacterium sp.]|uniref:winged helix-turn-helix domain-containing protein n=1 Tax=uncultured Corynebacterium sp. TaxID=159447 RepID=UPI0025EA4A0A|nr:winged helix-turn-helix domain-containing protein [uncultured Corynebacterium sp.]